MDEQYGITTRERKSRKHLEDRSLKHIVALIENNRGIRARHQSGASFYGIWIGGEFPGDPQDPRAKDRCRRPSESSPTRRRGECQREIS
ncbi:hypothetical protein [Sulfitobacter sp. 1A12779]|uniref:hypothetical protein n=1 Tax=Sulfitobacter sp. 1A12779 TaxID=3368599 RepID=UPI0037453C18